MTSLLFSPASSAATPALAPPQDLDAALILLQGLIAKVIDFLPNLVGALLFLLLGLWFAGRAKAVLQRVFDRSDHLDPLLETFLTSLVYYVAVALVIVTTLGMFGVQTTSLAAIIGAAGLAIGLALQGTLGHLASGVMLLAFRPFSIGDYVETAGLQGTVKAMSLFTTELATVDNKKAIVPNGEIWAGAIVNYSAYEKRRVDLVFGVSYSDDLNKAMAAIRSEVEKEDRVMTDPEPTIVVDNLGGSSVDIICRVWVASSDYFPVKWALTQHVKERFDADGVSIPFPTRTIVQEAAGHGA